MHELFFVIYAQWQNDFSFLQWLTLAIIILAADAAALLFV